MNKTRIFITLGVVVVLAWLGAWACSGKKPAPAAKAPVAIEKPVAKVEAPYTVTKSEPAFTAPAPQCKADPKLLPKKVQPKAKVAPAAPQKPAAAYHKVLGLTSLPVLLPNG